MLKVKAVIGDITRTKEKFEAIAMLTNSSEEWFGGVDKSIVIRCGWYYHFKLITLIGRQLPISDGQVFIIKWDKNQQVFSFKDIIFVNDKLELPLEKLSFIALENAQKAGYKKIAMPAMRTGVTSGVVEKTAEDAALSMIKGINSFKAKYPDSLLEVDIVVLEGKEKLKRFIEFNLD